jgi:RNA polymerase subunit RPABC4/transcription elongation factor Spt4
LYCTRCGKLASEGWNVCPHCGTSLHPAKASGLQNDVIGASPKDATVGRRRAPSPWFYALGPAVIVITTAVAVTLFVTGLLGLTPHTRFVVPGSHEVEFESAGKYYVFYEYRSNVDGVAYSTGEYLPGMVAALRSQDGSHTVPLKATTMSSTYEMGSRCGVSLYEFHIDDPGTYIFTAVYEDGSTRPAVVFALGQFDMLKVFLRSVPLGFGGFLLGVLILVWVFVKRRKAGRPI